MIELEPIREAAALLEGVAIRTPVFPSRLLGARAAPRC